MLKKHLILLVIFFSSYYCCFCWQFNSFDLVIEEEDEGCLKSVGQPVKKNFFSLFFFF